MAEVEGYQQMSRALDHCANQRAIAEARVAELEAIVSKIPQPQFERILQAVAKEQAEEKEEER